jgi:ArsR family transcriptional regulator
MDSPLRNLDDATLVRVFKALAHPKRFQMIQAIAGAGELSCGQVGERFPVAQPTISHHLKILHDAGLLLVRREAQHAFISIDRELLGAAFEALEGRIAPPAAAVKKSVKTKERARRRPAR